MTQQYLRVASLVVGDPSGKALDVSALRFSFQIAHYDTQTPKTIFARVYNAAPATVARAEAKEFTQLQLTAGYQGNSGVIFQGTIKQTRSGRESQTDTYLDFFASDGDEPYNQAIVNHSLAAGASSGDVRDKLLAAFGTYGYAPGNSPALSPIVLPRAQAFYGMARDHMRVLTRDNGCTWSLEDGRVNLVPTTGSLPNTAVVLTAATGLIGLPQQTQDGIAIRCLINPQIRKGGLVKLDNASIQRARIDQSYATLNGSDLPGINKTDGTYKVIWLDYVGDTRGQEWYCDLNCLAADGSGFIPPSVAALGGL